MGNGTDFTILTNVGGSRTQISTSKPNVILPTTSKGNIETILHLENAAFVGYLAKSWVEPYPNRMNQLEYSPYWITQTKFASFLLEVFY